MSEDSVSGGEAQIPGRHEHKGGKVNIFEPPNTREIMASPLTISHLKHVGCFYFCENVCQVQNQPELTRIFIINLYEK